MGSSTLGTLYRLRLMINIIALNVIIMHRWKVVNCYFDSPTSAFQFDEYSDIGTVFGSYFSSRFLNSTFKTRIRLREYSLTL